MTTQESPLPALEDFDADVSGSQKSLRDASIAATRRFLKNLVRVGSVAWLVAHFALTVLYVAPPNPIKIAYQPLLDATIGTFFPQDWTFFAPEPITSNFSVLVRPLTKVEATAAQSSGLPSDGWADLSTPFWQQSYRNRFSAYDRLARPQFNAAYAVTGGDRDYRIWYEECSKGDAEACKVVETQNKRNFSGSQNILKRIAFGYCNDIHVPSDVTFVAIRIRQSLSVPWSKRHTAKPQTKDVTLGVYPIDKTITGPGIFRARG